MVSALFAASRGSKWKKSKKVKKKKITRVERETNTNEDISFLTKSEARYICAFTSAIDPVVKSKQQTVKRNAYLWHVIKTCRLLSRFRYTISREMTTSLWGITPTCWNYCCLPPTSFLFGLVINCWISGFGEKILCVLVNLDRPMKDLWMKCRRNRLGGMKVQLSGGPRLWWGLLGTLAQKKKNKKRKYKLKKDVGVQTSNWMVLIKHPWTEWARWARQIIGPSDYRSECLFCPLGAESDNGAKPPTLGCRMGLQSLGGV